MAFKDFLDTWITIGYIEEGIEEVEDVEPSGPFPMPGSPFPKPPKWKTLYEAKARIRAREIRVFDLGGGRMAALTHRIYLLPVDVDGTLMELEEGLLAYEKVPFVWEEDKDLPNFRFRKVYFPSRRHFEVDAERVLKIG